MNYYISDTHFCHENIIKYCNRPFADVDAMDNVLITNWNSRVSENDTVYFLGDFMFGTTKKALLYLDKLNGKKHLVIGNHDEILMKKELLSKCFESYSRMMVIHDGGLKITLCHYPMMCFEGDYLVYGHIHNNKNDFYFSLLRTMKNALNTSVEVNGYIPVTLEKLIANNKKFRCN